MSFPSGEAPRTRARPVGRLRVVHASGVAGATLVAAVGAHHEAMDAGAGILKDGRRSAVTQVCPERGWLCVKEYRHIGWADRVRDALPGSRGRRAWRGAQRLKARGIAAPEALGLLEHGGTAYLVTRFIEGAGPLNELLLGRFAHPRGPSEVAARRALARQLGAWLRAAHDAGVYHDDWSAKNFLAAERDGVWSFYFLDFESVSSLKHLTWRRRVKNLGQLCDAPGGATRTDRMRFLVAYACGDRALLRGRFPRSVLAYARRRAAARERKLADGGGRRCSVCPWTGRPR